MPIPAHAKPCSHEKPRRDTQVIRNASCGSCSTDTKHDVFPLLKNRWTIIDFTVGR